MAFDAVPGGDPRGPWCRKCGQPVKPGQPSTQMYFAEDPDGTRGLTGEWHGECARPHWDKLSPLLKRFERGFGF